MKAIYSTCFFFFVCCSFVVQAQFSVSGKIIDSASGDPLPGASVYCQNTTIGTATNKQGEFSLQMKTGGYDLIITYTGYQTGTIRISSDTAGLIIPLIKQEKSMEEVVVRSSNEVTDGWEKYGTFFLQNFIGASPNASLCSIQNPEVLKFYFYKKSNKLKVLADSALIINNNALGYNLRYQLDSFVYYYKTNINIYRGYCLFSEMEGTDKEKKNWTVNRVKTYYGSKLHFMRSYYDSTLKEDGFSIDLLDENSDTKFIPVKNPYDTSYYGALDSTMEIEIWYPRKISVSYLKKRPESEYIKKFGLPKNVGSQISYIDLNDAIAIRQNGYYYDQKDWINQGYWSWKNLADQLPFDYEPPE
ncbi:MAG: carboxypeptidase-like regulatory domain-containing protein [Bacteroidetes bacterium]|nr:carboxypeptidase-like regulatory domain-containing protein [Bacteroidota bacterium]MBS1632714.1 carboxypeptidase-like regulatory domain-containing protein [Bacteroidota bacterium]